MDYYNTNAQSFINDTLELDLSELYKKFLDKVKGPHILDIGCGPGRDLRYFRKNGFTAIGVEPSSELAKFAKEFSGCEVSETSILDYGTDIVFDGVWACASLLHLNDIDLKKAFLKISSFMKESAILYCSFKYGEFKGERSGRYFNDQTEQSIKSKISEDLQIIDMWVTQDLRPERSEKWLNLTMTKSSQ